MTHYSLDSNTASSKAINGSPLFAEHGSYSPAWSLGSSTVCLYRSLYCHSPTQNPFSPTLNHLLPPWCLFLSHLVGLSPTHLFISASNNPLPPPTNHIARVRFYLLRETSLITPPGIDLSLQKISILLLVCTFHRVLIQNRLEMHVLFPRPNYKLFKTKVAVFSIFYLTQWRRSMSTQNYPHFLIVFR